MSDPELVTDASIARSLLERALTSLAADDWLEAVRDAGQALVVAPNRELQIVALEALALAHHALHNWDAACTAGIEALRIGSTSSADVLIAISRYFAANGDISRAFGVLEEGFAASRASIPLAGALALLAHQSGDYPKAVAWYDELDRLDPAGAPTRATVIDDLRLTIERNAQTRSVIERIGKRIATLACNRVVSGPFIGQRLEDNHDFGWVATLLGCYEMELHPAIEQVVASAPHRVINIGCSGGYYAVGFANRLRDCSVFAYDIDALAREACERTAIANGVAERVQVRSECTSTELQAIAGPGTFVFCDCEGYELQLLDPMAVPALRKTTIIVELHDIWIPDLTPRLLRRFVASHEISRLATIPRDAAQFPILSTAGLADWEIELALSDFRPPTMTWAYMVPR